MQIPLYPASIFQSENDGEGMNVVLYFKLSEKYSKDLPDQFRENISVRGTISIIFIVIVPHVREDFTLTLYDTSLTCVHVHVFLDRN